MGERVSLRAYAAHRDCVLAAVQKAIESGRLKEPAFGRDAEGRLEWVDVELADQQWAANTDPAAAAKAGKFVETPAMTGAPDLEPGANAGVAEFESDSLEELERRESPAGDLVDEAGKAAPGAAAPAASSSTSDYQRSRAQREHYAAEEARLNYFRQRGELVVAADVREAQFRRYRALRDKLLNIPDRVASILAAERDEAQIHATLTQEIKLVLNDLSTDADAEATGGAPERVAA